MTQIDSDKSTALLVSELQDARPQIAELRRGLERHRDMVENSHDIIYMLSVDGVFTFVSPAWIALLGHPLTQVLGQPFQQFVHPDDFAACMAFLQSVLRTGQRQEGVECRVRPSEGPRSTPDRSTCS